MCVCVNVFVRAFLQDRDQPTEPVSLGANAHLQLAFCAMLRCCGKRYQWKQIAGQPGGHARIH